MGIAAKLHSIYWTSDVQSDVGTSLLGQIVGHTLHSWSGSVLKCRWWKRNWHIIPRINWLFCIAQVCGCSFTISDSYLKTNQRSDDEVIKRCENSACHKSSSVQLKKRTREKAVLVPAKAMCLTFPFLTGETFRKLLMVSIWWERRKSIIGAQFVTIHHIFPMHSLAVGI